MDPTYPDAVMEASVSLHGPNPKALSRLDIPQSSVVATNQRQNEAETCQSEMQGWWDQSIRKYLGLPDGYQKVSVLLIKWDDEIVKGTMLTRDGAVVHPNFQPKTAA